MKKIIYIIQFVLVVSFVNAQQKYVVETENFYSSVPSAYGGGSFANKTFLATQSITLKTGFSVKASDGTFVAKVFLDGENTPISSDKNFIRTDQILVSGKTTDAQITSLEDGTNKFTTYQYSDGMGRNLQTVNVQGSISGKDMVSFSEYDAYGRQPKAYLPYSASTSNGQFQSNLTTNQAAFYNSPPTGVSQDSRPFTEYAYDGARVTSVTGLGQAWSGKSSSSITKVSTSTSIRMWTINGSGYPESTSRYPANLLVYTESTDVNGQISREFKDQWGRVVLSEIDNGGTLVQTYYVYDIRGNVLAIIPPKAVDLVRGSDASTWSVSSDIGDGLCYINRYDPKGRIIEKHVPGKVGAYANEVVYYVYDQWNRLVLTQDGNQRTESPDEWTFTKYDAFSRPIITGIYKSNNSRSTLQSSSDTGTGHHENRTNNATGYTLSNSFPDMTGDEDDLLAITYYDDYAFVSYSGWDAEGNNFNWDGVETGFTGVKSTAVKGQVTGSKTRVLSTGTGIWLNAATYYDADYQPLHTIVENHLGGIDEATTEYDFTGQILKTQYDHASTYGSISLLEEYEYDNGGRLVNTFQTVNEGDRVLVANNVYNEMGEQIERNLHSTDNGASFLQSMDYRSNIRGWLTSVNNADLSSGGSNDDSNDLFGMELDYTTGATVAGTTIPANFDGNISVAKWQSNNLEDAPKKQAFGYKYDNLGRITSANYAADNSGNWTGDQNYYSTTYSYKDVQGGFDQVTREGRLGEASTTTIDDLTYSYYANSNQISKVLDDSDNDEGFSDGFNSTTEFTYDPNGNLVSDQNTFITGITYNLLDKPERITVEPTTGKIYLDFTYDAAGNKLTTSIKDAGENELYRMDYVGGIHYVTTDGTTELAYMQTPEGRILKYGSEYEHEYHIKDHLGNTRLTFGNLHDTEVFNATMETELSSTEEAQFVNVGSTRDGVHNHTKASYEVLSPSYSSRIAQDMTGPGIAIPVLAGDKVSAEVWALFNDNQSSSSAAAIGGLLSNVSAMFNITPGESPATYQALSDALGLLAADWGNPSSDVPEAYLNLVFISNDNLTNDFSYDKITASAFTAHEKLTTNYTAPSDGVIYVYMANENSEAGDVWFDDLLVVHEKTTSSLYVTQVNDYYPFGMVMAGTAYNDISREPQLYKFNGNEVLEGKDIPSTLSLMDFNARLYNPALGVFLAVDPYADSFSGLTPYGAFGNNPIVYVDPDGEFLWWVPLIYGAVNLASDAIQGNINSFEDGLKSFGMGALMGTVVQIMPGAQQFAAWGSGGGWQALTGAISGQLPSLNIPIGDNFIFTLSPYFAVGPEALVYGAYATATFYDEDKFAVSFGAGKSNMGYSLSGSWTQHGFTYYHSYLGGGSTRGQHTGGVGYSNGKGFSFRFENDVLAFRRQDRWRTGGIEFQFGDFVLGTYVDTNDPKNEGSDFDRNGLNMAGKKNKSPRRNREWGSWIDGLVNSSPLYVGYKLGRNVYRAGVNAPIIQDKTQNFIHRNIMAQNYYNKYSDYKGPYFQIGNQNPFSIYYY